MTIIWILALITSTLLSIFLTSAYKNSIQKTEIERLKTEASDSAFLEGFDSGWESASNDLTNIKAAYRKMFGISL